MGSLTRLRLAEPDHTLRAILRARRPVDGFGIGAKLQRSELVKSHKRKEQTTPSGAIGGARAPA